MPILIPFAKYLGPEFFNKEDNPSTHNRNKYGDIGSPCQSPLDGLKKLEYSPFTRTEKETIRTHSIIHCVQASLKPSASIIS